MKNSPYFSEELAPFSNLKTVGGTKKKKLFENKRKRRQKAVLRMHKQLDVKCTLPGICLKIYLQQNQDNPWSLGL